MSGHSKWNNIKRKKEKADGAKAKIFTKIGRELAVAVKQGGDRIPLLIHALGTVLQKQKQLMFQMRTSNELSRKLRVKATTRNLKALLTKVTVQTVLQLLWKH
jgi:transcriptional/translational regulatory protein YebC/TACO1